MVEVIGIDHLSHLLGHHGDLLLQIKAVLLLETQL